MRDRRIQARRRALVRRVIDEVFSHRSFAVYTADCARRVGAPAAVCERILRELERSGLVMEARPGIWTRRALA